MKTICIILTLALSSSIYGQNLQDLLNWSTKSNQQLATYKFSKTIEVGDQVNYARPGTVLTFPKKKEDISYTFTIENKKAIKTILSDIQNTSNQCPNWKNKSASKDLGKNVYFGSAKIDGVVFDLEISYHNENQITLTFDELSSSIVYVRTIDQTFNIEEK